MKLTELVLDELDREATRSRRTLENIPKGSTTGSRTRKSMIFGYLADMVAIIPSWIMMMSAERA